MRKDIVISARVSREFRDRFDRIAVSLGMPYRSSAIEATLRHFMAEVEAGRIRRVDRR